MKMFRPLRYLLAAFVMCFASLSFATVLPAHHFITVAALSQGGYSEAMTHFQARQALAMSGQSSHSASTSALLSDGHGFLQARADATIGQGVGNQVS